MHKLELVDVDGSLGLALPEQALKRLGLGLGDTVLITEKDGSLYLASAAPAPDTDGPPPAPGPA